MSKSISLVALCAMLFCAGQVFAWYSTDFEDPPFNNDTQIKGQDGWWGNNNNNWIRKNNWGMDPVSPLQLGLIRRGDTTAVVDDRVNRSFSDTLVADPFQASAYMAQDLDVKGGRAVGQMCLWGGSGDDWWRGPSVGFTTTAATGDDVYLYIMDDVADAPILLDADPTTPGVVDPASRMTWYKFVVDVRPGAYPGGTRTLYDLSVYDAQGTLLDTALNVPTRNHAAALSFDQVMFRAWNDSTAIKDTRLYIDDVSIVPEPATLALLGLGTLLGLRRRKR